MLRSTNLLQKLSLSYDLSLPGCESFILDNQVYYSFDSVCYPKDCQVHPLRSVQCFYFLLHFIISCCLFDLFQHRPNHQVLHLRSHLNQIHPPNFRFSQFIYYRLSKDVFARLRAVNPITYFQFLSCLLLRSPYSTTFTAILFLQSFCWCIFLSALISLLHLRTRQTNQEQMF